MGMSKSRMINAEKAVTEVKRMINTDKAATEAKCLSSPVLDIADRVKGALYGLLIADAIAMPSHWYYGGQSQVSRAYGNIKGYVQPTMHLPGSIMSKSDTGGGGRGGYSGDVIGKVIFHGKKKFWAPGADYHYHHALSAGDNTLEGLLMRRVVNITAAAGKFAPDQILSDYINFMQTPSSHNDTYCSTAHRMFFANLAAGKDPQHCPDNDNHNVDTCDAFITAVPIALLPTTDQEAAENVKTVVKLTRKSPEGAKYAEKYAKLLRAVVFKGADIQDTIHDMFKMTAKGPDPMTA